MALVARRCEVQPDQRHHRALDCVRDTIPLPCGASRLRHCSGFPLGRRRDRPALPVPRRVGRGRHRLGLFVIIATLAPQSAPGSSDWAPFLAAFCAWTIVSAAWVGAVDPAFSPLEFAKSLAKLLFYAGGHAPHARDAPGRDLETLRVAALSFAGAAAIAIAIYAAMYVRAAAAPGSASEHDPGATLRITASSCAGSARPASDPGSTTCSCAPSARRQRAGAAGRAHGTRTDSRAAHAPPEDASARCDHRAAAISPPLLPSSRRAAALLPVLALVLAGARCRAAGRLQPAAGVDWRRRRRWWRRRLPAARQS